ncbi:MULTISPECIES: hypothetical protein [unclassified Pseudomonas]|uniref:hypothetical protein n=1 Tax=unclassified Pseudomonas TaxID=196821 RepID=UPI002AC9012C|nr:MULTISPECIES: hypothetical protein [unclassified Pseudomonas]MEB0041542.1 hypothetical protein [Pseudomonas sp. MH10]MEB0075974.1 hypothetical protein [Pseudomonas sp. MH10out]MEB0101419.1 hypothetical protein [Pseudomonas sp. CCI3.2]MEB0122568.1 hypothetical protein [Pseudomonas sp. CCI1.2]MEB0130953.1 hypothetical protein [Pseudomonas sp. CCI2.4]
MPTHPLKLILCIALGVWLGCVAVAVTGVFAYDSLIASKVSAVSAAINQIKFHIPHKGQAAPESTPEQEQAPELESNNSMFEKYKQNLQDTQARQDDDQAKAVREKRISGPKCQFWLQQDQTAPSEKTRANVNLFCG